MTTTATRTPEPGMPTEAARPGRRARARVAQFGDAALVTVPAASVAVFRIALGLALAGSMARYLSRGWVSTQLTEPVFRVRYPGFGWVDPLPAPWMHLVVVIVAAAGVALALGWHQRAAASVALLGFAWVELIDASTYLNHYELVTLLLAWAVVLPMSRAWSLDRRAGRVRGPSTVGRWVVWVLRAQLAVVYLFAGVAKLDVAWLVHAEPLTTWLAARTDTPVVGPLLDHAWAGPVASWAGALFDLGVVWLLCWRRSRPFAYGAVVVFHTVTWLLFPAIGVFPAVMIVLTPVFFEPDWPLRLVARGRRALTRDPLDPDPGATGGPATGPAPDGLAADPVAVPPVDRRRARPVATVAAAAILVVFAAQVAVPLRHLVEPGDVRWDEVGYRWSWRVMLTERNGVATVELVDPTTGATERVPLSTHLAPHQVRYVSSRPEALRQVAHWLADRRADETGVRPEVHVTAWVSVNGSRRAMIVDPTVDLAAQPFELGRPDWVLPAPPDL